MIYLFHHLVGSRIGTIEVEYSFFEWNGFIAAGGDYQYDGASEGYDYQFLALNGTERVRATDYIVDNGVYLTEESYAARLGWMGVEVWSFEDFLDN